MKKISFLRNLSIIFICVALVVTAVCINGSDRFVQAATAIENGDFETVGTESDPIPGFVFDNGCCIGYDVKITADPTNNRSGKVLSVGTGTSYDTSGLHSFRIYQAIEVSPYTDYIWELYMLPTAGSEQFLGIVAGDTVNKYKNTTVAAAASVVEGSITLTPNTFAEGAQATMSGAADPNWFRFAVGASGWKKLRLSFNSGSFTTVSLCYSARASGRGILFDDWKIRENNVNTVIENGDFETVGTDDDPIPGFVYNSGSSIGADVHITANHGTSNSSNVLSVDSGTSYDSSGLHSFRIYQAVEVSPDTDYVWEFEVLPTQDKNHYFGVVAGDTVNANKNTALPVTAETVSGTLTLTPNNINAGAQSNANGTAADTNWIHFENQGGDWKKVRVIFNSGSNDTVSLAYVARASGRRVLFDNWTIKKYEVVTEVSNGDFEQGTTGYDYDDSYITATAQKDTVFDGEYSLKLKTDVHSFDKAHFGQYVQVEKNTYYEWHFRYRSATPDSRVFVGVLSSNKSSLVASKLTTNGGFVDAEFASFPSLRTVYTKNWHEGLTNGDWAEYTVTFFSGENTTVCLALNLVAKGRCGYTDNWSIVKSGVTSIS